MRYAALAGLFVLGLVIALGVRACNRPETPPPPVYRITSSKQVVRMNESVTICWQTRDVRDLSVTGFGSVVPTECRPVRITSSMSFVLNGVSERDGQTVSTFAEVLLEDEVQGGRPATPAPGAGNSATPSPTTPAATAAPAAPAAPVQQQQQQQSSVVVLPDGRVVITNTGQPPIVIPAPSQTASPTPNPGGGTQPTASATPGPSRTPTATATASPGVSPSLATGGDSDSFVPITNRNVNTNQITINISGRNYTLQPDGTYLSDDGVRPGTFLIGGRVYFALRIEPWATPYLVPQGSTVYADGDLLEYNTSIFVKGNNPSQRFVGEMVDAAHLESRYGFWYIPGELVGKPWCDLLNSLSFPCAGVAKIFQGRAP